MTSTTRRAVSAATARPSTLPAGVSPMGVAAGAKPAKPVRWCRSSCPCGRERGSVDRAQMRFYALAVAVALVGRAACVHCGAGVSLHDGEVDRTVEGVCYAPGGVVMVCRACNNARNTEVLDTERYAADVARASRGVAVPSGSAAMRAYRAAEDAPQLSRSPYAL